MRPRRFRPMCGDAEIDAAVAKLAPGGGLIVPPDTFTPVAGAIYSDRQIIREDGYGPETADIFRRAVLTSIASEVIE